MNLIKVLTCSFSVFLFPPILTMMHLCIMLLLEAPVHTKTVILLENFSSGFSNFVYLSTKFFIKRFNFFLLLY